MFTTSAYYKIKSYLEGLAVGDKEMVVFTSEGGELYSFIHKKFRVGSNQMLFHLASWLFLMLLWAIPTSIQLHTLQ